MTIASFYTQLLLGFIVGFNMFTDVETGILVAES